ncbi:MAG: HutD family protein [Polaromonas sp.]|nr:HutD family protein [Polaromonas sp.]
MTQGPASLGHGDWQITPLVDVPPSPWKNGGGVTRELAAWPNTQDWVWRMSVAEVASDGPFSRFDGVQRWFAVLGGAGVQLAMEPPAQAQTHRLTPESAPLCFAGEEPVFCTLIAGATQDFNLMLRRGAASGRMLRVEGTFSDTAHAEKMVAVYTVDKGASVSFGDEVLDLPPQTLAWRHCPVGTRLQVTAGRALWMEMAP